MKIFVVLSLFLCSVVRGENKENLVMEEFDIKPGGERTSFERNLKNYQCTFTYQAQGGTNEKWRFVLEKAEDGKTLECSVLRGGDSYMFFEDFNLSLTGPGVHLEEFDAVSTKEDRLEDSEIKMDKKNKMLHAVKGSFKQKLEKVVLRASLGKKKKEQKKEL